MADKLSREKITSCVGSLSRVAVDFTMRVRRKAPHDSTYQKLVEQVKEGTTRRYRLENELLYFTRGKLYVPSSQTETGVAKGDS